MTQACDSFYVGGVKVSIFTKEPESLVLMWKERDVVCYKTIPHTNGVIEKTIVHFEDDPARI